MVGCAAIGRRGENGITVVHYNNNNNDDDDNNNNNGPQAKEISIHNAAATANERAFLTI